MPILATVVAIVALAAGVFLGFAIASSRRKAVTVADLAPPDPAEPARRRPTQPLASLVVEALDHGVVVLDREERAVLVNPAARGMGILDVDTLVFPGLVGLARKSLETGEHLTASIDLPMGRLGREPIALSVNAVPLLPGVDDRVAAVCLLLADVSEQRRLEAVRRDFVANVSHELKTPVGALTLLAEAIIEAADDPDAVQHFAARM
ncbi:MAG: two-component system, OmpR family, sensor histidine kinase SenX3, partial [Pseudonocardiales bacterium]|nr:two-component system, OmpR family, sensor histidine kinase SenX3 [Pseudonocardiales bacterium]